MLIIFCDNELVSGQIDPVYKAEYEAAQAAGFATAILCLNPLGLENNVMRATRKIEPQPEMTPALYRGWMLNSYQYMRLCSNLERKNIRLINDLQAYVQCHHLPEWYELLKNHTPASVWLQLPQNGVFLIPGAFPAQGVQELLKPFGNKPLIVKDYVKSRKHG
jgi:hypothetical protein